MQHFRPLRARGSRLSGLQNVRYLITEAALRGIEYASISNGLAASGRRKSNCVIWGILDMVKRSSSSSSEVFKNVLRQAGERVLVDAGAAENLAHRGLRGNERANALRKFLGEHLPAVFEIGNGEAIDYKDTRTGELDLFIYDRATASALQSSSDSVLIPAEALYAAIEVKTTLTREELGTSAVAAGKVRRLKPFKTAFVESQIGGQAATGRCRCAYHVFAYATNLSADSWAEKELKRVEEAALAASVGVDVFDRIIVLGRGIIQPQSRIALLESDSDGLFLEFYLHLINFLTRERARRKVIDWTAYTARKKWTKLG